MNGNTDMEPPLRGITARFVEQWGLPLLLGLTLAVYSPVAGFDFILLDDNLYVFENPMVKRGLGLDGVLWALTTFHAANWHPLTWISLMVDVSLFGVAPGVHHLVNVAFHLLNTALLFLVLRQMTGRHGLALWVAALFALHPLHVESVAWISERKDVLSTAFWLLTIGAYHRYVRAHERKWYLLSLMTMILGLMSKPMLVTVPLTLLILDVWPLERISLSGSFPWARVIRLSWEKAPFFLLSIAAGLATIAAQRTGNAVSDLMDLPFAIRASNAIVAYGVYLFQTIWPVSLTLFYPHPLRVQIFPLITAMLGIGLISALAIECRRTRPYWIAGWLWFFVTLIPVIGLLQVGAQSHADRYTYVPLIGIFVAIVWELDTMGRIRFSSPRILPIGGLLALMALTGVSIQGISLWRDSEILFTHAIQVTDRNFLAYNNIGVFYARNGEIKKSISHFQKALDIVPSYEEARRNLELARKLLAPRYAEENNFDAAREELAKIFGFSPESANAYHALGTLLMDQSRWNEAANALKKAVSLEDTLMEAHNDLGIALLRIDDVGGALRHFQRAAELNPSDAGVRENLRRAEALERSGVSPLSDTHEEK